LTGIVVGASGGIGAACAIALSTSVERLVLVGRSDEKLASTAQMSGPHAIPVVADITLEAGRAAVAEACGTVPISWLVMASGLPLRGKLVDSDPTTIERTLVTNLVGPALLIRRLLDCAWADGAGIVAIGSISANRALPNRAVYGGSKAGFEHLCRTLAAELAPRSIRVNVVAPGVIDTPFLGDNGEAVQKWVEERVPARRMGRANEVAALVKYVLIDSPEFLTGARIAVDGGAEVLG
jgi:NAD(P)-dependent dehydrogenase (short-subunit alcohol dehydrogenase family)